MASNMDDKKDELEEKDRKHRGNISNPSSSKWIDNVFLIFNLVWVFIFVKTVTSIANSMVSSQQPLILKRLGANEAMMGTVMSLQFGFGGFSNAFLLAPVTRIMGGKPSLVVRNCLIVLASGHLLRGLLYSNSHNVLNNWFSESDISRMYPFIGISLFLAIFQFSLASSISASSSEIVDKTMQGTLVGIQHCLFAFAHMIGPQLGAYIYGVGDISGLCVVGALIFALVTKVFTRNYKEEPKLERRI